MATLLHCVLTCHLAMVVFGYTEVGAELQRVSKIISQKDCPIEIVEYKISYRKIEKGIWHTPRFINLTNKPIVAVEFRFVQIDVFENLLDHVRYVEIDDIIPQRNRKKRNAEKPFKFDRFQRGSYLKKTLTSYVYIYKIRFENSEIWEYDKPEVLNQIIPNHVPFELEEPGAEQSAPGDNKA